MSTAVPAGSQWKSERKYTPEEVKQAVENMPMEERQRRVGPILAIMTANVAHRVREQLGEQGAAVIRKAAQGLTQRIGVDMSPEKIDVTTADYKALMRYVAGTDDIRSLDTQKLGAAYFAFAALLMQFSCEVLDKLGDEKGGYIIQQAWEEIAQQPMYWDAISDQFELDGKDARTAMALLAGSDSLMGVQYELIKMTPTKALRNITYCTPVAVAWGLGYSHETVRKFCECVAGSVCIKGPASVVPGIKVRYLTRMSHGDHSCMEVMEIDPEEAKKASKASKTQTKKSAK